MLQQKSVDFIRIDINSGQVRKAISICQSDPTMRTLAMTIVDSGVPVVSDELLYAEILIKKADGEHEAINGCVIDGDAIEYTLRSTDISALGENIAQIMLTYKDGAVITTPPFIISVYDKVLNPNVQKSLNEYTSITQQVVIATNNAEEARKVREEAETILENVKIYEESTKEASIVAFESEKNAAMSASNAQVSEDNASASANSATASASNAKESEKYVHDALEVAMEYAEKILSVEVDVKEDADRADRAADRAEATLGKLDDEVERAKAEADRAAGENVKAAYEANRAEAGANEANSYVTQASGYATNASDYSTLSKSYAMGDTGVRELEDTENARYFYEQSKAIYERLGSALAPKGTIAFESLPAFDDVDEGWMYNISNDFTTDSRFVDGSGKNYSAGNNIYCIEDNGTKKWDVLASPAIVRKATTSELGIVKPDGITITVDEDGTIHGTPQPTGIQVEEVSKADFDEDPASYEEQDVMWFIKDDNSINLPFLRLTKAQYMAKKDYYDSLPYPIDVTDWEVQNSYEVPHKESTVGATLDALEEKCNQEYSTEERKVGSWIDGKDVYEKTFVGSITSKTTSSNRENWEQTVADNISEYIKIDGYVKRYIGSATQVTPFGCTIMAGDKTVQQMSNLYLNSDNSLSISCNNATGIGVTSWDYCITVRYTKI